MINNAEFKKRQFEALAKDNYFEVRILAQSDRQAAIDFKSRLIGSSPVRRIICGFGKPADILQMLQQQLV